MIQIQIVLGEIKNKVHLAINLLEREDCTDGERKLAQNIENLTMEIVKELPHSNFKKISKPCTEESQ